jgi:ABC-2 type transport system permease protein
MLFAWVDRWLSTRRAREVFTALIFIFSLGIQWLNLTFNPAYNHPARFGVHGTKAANVSPEKLEAATRLYHHVLPWIAIFPPNLTASALQAAQSAAHLSFLIDVLGCALYAAAFYLIFAWRTRVEYRGENFSDQANAVTKPLISAASPAFTITQPSSLPAASLPVTTALSPPATQRGIIGALLSKEFLTLRRNTGIAYGVLAPVFLVFIFAFKLAAGRHFVWLFPAATVYALMGIVPLAYNTFGLEGPGVQFHFMAPVRIRDVIVAKNLMSFALAALDLVLVYAVISYASGVPPLRMTIAGILWAASMIFLGLTIGNRRSITAPKKIEPGRSASKQASPLSSLISFLVLFTGAGLGAGLFFAERWLNSNWLLLPVLAVAVIAAFITYKSSLNSIDKFAFDNREQLFAELCKQ